LASGAPPRERKDAVWAGFELAGGLWVLSARSARFSSVKHARTHTHTHAHTRTYTHTHTHTHTHTRTAVQGAPIRRIRPHQSILLLTCCAHRTESPNPAYFGWRQEMRARDSGHRAASAGLFAPAGEPASRGSLRVGTWNVSAQRWLLCLRPGKPPPVACACGTNLHIVRSDRGHSPAWRPLAACSSYPGTCCIPADPRASGRPWAATVALSSHGHTVHK
jgi:hypothetical protein